MTGDTCASLGMKNETMRLERLESKRLKTKERERLMHELKCFFQSVFTYFIQHRVFLKRKRRLESVSSHRQRGDLASPRRGRFRERITRAGLGTAREALRSAFWFRWGAGWYSEPSARFVMACILSNGRNNQGYEYSGKSNIRGAGFWS